MNLTVCLPVCKRIYRVKYLIIQATEQVLFDYRKKLPVRLVLTEACGLCSVHCSSVLLQIFLWLLGGGLPAARGQWVPPQQKNRWCIFVLSLWPHEAFLQPPWNLCRPLFLGLCVVCHWTYSYSRTSRLDWLSTKLQYMRVVTASIENVITTQNSTGNDDEEYLTFLVLFLMDIKYDGALKMKCFNDFLLSKVVLFPTFAREASSQVEGDDNGRFVTEKTEKRKKSSSYCNLYWKIMFPFQSVILQSNKNTPSDW